MKNSFFIHKRNFSASTIVLSEKPDIHLNSDKIQTLSSDDITMTNELSEKLSMGLDELKKSNKPADFISMELSTYEEAFPNLLPLKGKFELDKDKFVSSYDLLFNHIAVIEPFPGYKLNLLKQESVIQSMTKTINNEGGIMSALTKSNLITIEGQKITFDISHANGAIVETLNAIRENPTILENCIEGFSIVYIYTKVCNYFNKTVFKELDVKNFTQEQLIIEQRFRTKEKLIFHSIGGLLLSVSLYCISKTLTEYIKTNMKAKNIQTETSNSWFIPLVSANFLSIKKWFNTLSIFKKAIFLFILFIILLFFIVIFSPKIILVKSYVYNFIYPGIIYLGFIFILIAIFFNLFSLFLIINFYKNKNFLVKFIQFMPKFLQTYFSDMKIMSNIKWVERYITLHTNFTLFYFFILIIYILLVFIFFI